MKSINRVTLIGAVGKDPEMRHTQQGMAIANFSLATSKLDKEKNDVTQWHNLVAFNKTAELIEKYVTKGSKVYIEGELQYQQYEKDGENRYSTKIVINQISFLGDSGNHSSNPHTRKASDNGKQQHRAEEFDDSEIPF